jgi:steroid 5-alpha reductase family enzyme
MFNLRDTCHVTSPTVGCCHLQVGFGVSVVLKTDKFFDLTGSVSFFAIALASLIYGGSYHARQIAVSTLVCVWAARLGSYLFKRVLATGKDSRFDEIKGNPRRSLRPIAIDPHFLCLTVITTGVQRQLL